MRNLRPKKHLGQHFLKDPAIADRIVAQLSAGPEEEVVEIGPGEGILTAGLLARYPRLKMVEVDDAAVGLLRRRFELAEGQLIHADVLKWDWQSGLQPDSYLIGNLPYNISSPFFFRLLEHLPLVRQGVFMVQQEVAARICAAHGSKTYGILSVLLGACFERHYLFDVPPSAFRPPPRVMSAVLRLERKPGLPGVQPDKLKQLVKMAFNQRRKQLKNALKGLVIPDFEGKEKLLQLRAEQLSVADFIWLARQLEQS
ncbi:MAG: ribosomal RNA small subunit methyltransferase A [Bacteroidetes bacterium]|nr:MAG: ribosomal RNA small subunit methyltransferase A [Bacteroidota bacterium]